ncbi:hypothetical protein [Parageobacillus thermoglucosidasius]|uniref:hypothetical protein n=1 Tax=Parageobacillus thermoglucosidasius TaxID=1426 RepID=UPI000B56A380|nr:hypothetical protein [Parageobacillus thermoglucosidasius]MBY6268860.1 hypothetical protein [Parageobacillus thermoglucosidasius]OUM89247.1 MAG: hypothetical protein BAA00_13515 [Parageobacillus thermoglucosidasius]
MKMRELCNILGIEDRAPVIYDSKLAQKTIIQCQFCTPEEQKISIDFDPEVYPSEKGIHVKNISVEEFNELMRKGHPPDYLFIRRMINENIDYKIDMFDIVYACFCLYHEEGHWLDFKKSGLTGREFMKLDAVYRKHVYELAEKIKVETNPILINQMAYQHSLLYRNIPMEKSADEYAISKLKEIDWKYLEEKLKK